MPTSKAVGSTITGKGHGPRARDFGAVEAAEALLRAGRTRFLEQSGAPWTVAGC